MGSSFEDLDARISKIKTIRNLNEQFSRYFLFRTNVKNRKVRHTHPLLASHCDQWQARRIIPRLLTPQCTTCHARRRMNRPLQRFSYFRVFALSILPKCYSRHAQKIAVQA
jgi:hypothetical protein